MVAQIDSSFSKLSFKKTYTRFLSYAFYEGRPLTTKGRWINPFVSFLYRLQVNFPFAKPVLKPIFILGTGRSGTTILGVTLGIHKDAGFLNEPKALWSFLYSDEDLIGSYQKKPGKYRLNEKDASLSLIKKAHSLFGSYLFFGCASRVVDKYPELIFRTEFVSKIFPDARFLFLFRDGRDTCHSIQNWSERLGVENQGETHDWWGRNNQKWILLCEQIVANDDVLGGYVEQITKYTNHQHRAAVEWIVTMKEGLALMHNNPEQVLGIKYEDYVSQVKTRQQVLDFCELPSDHNFVQYCETVLKAPKAKPNLHLPDLIQNEFLRVMEQLGYE